MELQKKLGLCFGSEDQIIGSHASEEKCLRDLIKACRANNLTFKEFEKEVIYYLWKKNIHESIRIEHINQQIHRLKDYWT